MNLSDVENLEILCKLRLVCKKIGARMIATPTGFLVSRTGTTNLDLRKMLKSSVRRGYLDELVYRSWGWGENHDEGLHFTGL